MLAIGSVLALSAAVGLHFWNLSRGVYRRLPVEILLLLAASASLGFLSMSRVGGLPRTLLFALEALVLAAAGLYLLFMARFPRQRLTVSVGDRMPRFELPDSDGGRFVSERLEGRTSVLYLFYRGDW